MINKKLVSTTASTQGERLTTRHRAVPLASTTDMHRCKKAGSNRAPEHPPRRQKESTEGGQHRVVKDPRAAVRLAAGLCTRITSDTTPGMKRNLKFIIPEKNIMTSSQNKIKNELEPSCVSSCIRTGTRYQVCPRTSGRWGDTRCCWCCGGART